MMFESVAGLYHQHNRELHCVKAGSTPCFPLMPLPILKPADFQTDCGTRLRAVISRLGLQLVEAAEIMGVSKHTLNHWLKGNHPVQPYPLYRLSVAKGIDFNFIFLGDWSRLPFSLADGLEAEVIAKLGALTEPAAPAVEKHEPTPTKRKSSSAHSKPRTKRERVSL